MSCVAAQFIETYQQVVNTSGKLIILYICQSQEDDQYRSTFVKTVTYCRGSLLINFIGGELQTSKANGRQFYWTYLLVG